jgi:hypothetical protein
MHQKITFTTIIITALAMSGCLGLGAKKPVDAAASLVKRAGDQVVSGSFAVAPRTFTPFKFAVKAGSSKLELDGTFSAAGGANNDIEAMLFEESQFLNWQNGHKFTATYQSGRVTADRIKIALPPDPVTYVMVFSNRFSIVSSKDVKADLKLQYDRGTR